MCLPEFFVFCVNLFVKKMSLKRFNHQYSSILNGRNSFSAENEARIDDLLKETAAADDYIEGVQELPVVLNNLGQIVLQFGPKSGNILYTIKLYAIKYNKMLFNFGKTENPSNNRVI